MLVGVRLSLGVEGALPKKDAKRQAMAVEVAGFRCVQAVWIRHCMLQDTKQVTCVEWQGHALKLPSAERYCMSCPAKLNHV